MTYLADEVDRPEALQRVWSGLIAADAIDSLDRVPVVLTGLDNTLRWDDCRWMPRADAMLPKRGDDCVVLMDDNRELWIVGWTPQSLTPVYVTSLPASPLDGQRVALVNSLTNPAYQWHLRYNASSTSAYKWEFLGGFPQRVGPTGTDVTWSDATWHSAVISLNAPRAGEYEFIAEGYVQHSGSFTSAYDIIFRLNGSTFGNTFGYTIFTPVQQYNGGRFSVSDMCTLISGETITPQFSSSSAYGSAVRLAALKLLPKRVS